MKTDYLIWIGLILILLTGVFVIQYYFNSQRDECVRNPLVFGAKQMEETFGYPFVGSGFIFAPVGTEMPTFSFNSTLLERTK